MRRMCLRAPQRLAGCSCESDRESGVACGMQAKVVVAIAFGVVQVSQAPSFSASLLAWNGWHRHLMRRSRLWRVRRTRCGGANPAPLHPFGLRALLSDTPPSDLARVLPGVVPQGAPKVHGGLGTTSEALRAGRPICVTGPLLLDQRFWGAVCYSRGVVLGGSRGASSGRWGRNYARYMRSEGRPTGDGLAGCGS